MVVFKLRVKTRNTINPAMAIRLLHHIRTEADNVMRAPRIAVKASKMTAIWSSIYARRKLTFRIVDYLCARIQQYAHLLFSSNLTGMSLRIGDKAPDFSLYSSEKELINLQDFQGKNVVLLFFPLAFTSTCTKEMCATRDDMSIYNELNTEVLGISIDTTSSLARFKQDLNLNFKLLSDFNKEVIRSYDVVYEEYGLGMKGVGKRAVYVIDGEGIIRHIEVLEKAGNMPDLEAIKEALRSLVAA